MEQLYNVYWRNNKNPHERTLDRSGLTLPEAQSRVDEEEPRWGSLIHWIEPAEEESTEAEVEETPVFRVGDVVTLKERIYGTHYRVVAVRDDKIDVQEVHQEDCGVSAGNEPASIFKLVEGATMSQETEATQVKAEPKTLHQAALENLIAQGLKEGSRVRVLFGLPLNESGIGGWRNSWVDHMNAAVGQILTVRGTPSDAGVNLCGVPGGGWTYPAFALELPPEPKSATIRLNDNYNAGVTQGEDHITVGCQTIPLSAIQEVVAKLKEFGDWPED